ncbi:hypothetical protein ACP0HM_02265 [Escherichia coli]
MKKDGDELDITGDLTLNGVTKTRHAGSEINWSGRRPMGGKRAGFEAEGKN